MARFLIDTDTEEVHLVTDPMRGKMRRIGRQADKKEVAELESFLGGWEQQETVDGQDAVVSE